MNFIYRLYAFIFARKCFAKLNRLMFHLGIRGLGVLNYEGGSSGEEWFISKRIATNEAIIVFDVGANVGLYSKAVMGFCKNAVIYAFEPHPRNFKILAGVEGIQAHNLALGSSESSIELFDYAGAADGSQHASFYKEVIEDIHHGQSTAHQVRCTRLDDFCKAHGVERIDFLKIDTEGNEFEVLMGAENLLKLGKIKVIQFEFNEMNVVSRVYMRDFVKLLDGYELYRLLPAGLLPLRYSPLGGELFAYQNIVAIAKSAQRS